MEEVVAPVFHEYNPPPVAARSALSPMQMACEVTLVLMLGLTVTIEVAVAEHPDELVTVTE